MADTAYLKRRRGKHRSGYRWYVRVVVPSEVRETLRLKTIERCLHTSDFKEAQRLRHSVLAEIFESFERAKQHKLTSADIEHEAQRYLREQLDAIQAHPGDTFEPITDSFGNVIGFGGQDSLVILCEALEEHDWTPNVREEAVRIARRYGVALTELQSAELCRALQCAEIEALSRAISIHNGSVPEPVAPLNALAVDPLTAVARPRTRPEPKQGKGMRFSEAADAYISDRNRQRRTAWTGQTLNQSRATLRMFAEFSRDAPIVAITRKDVARYLSTIAGLHPSYGRRSATEKMTLEQLQKKFAAGPGNGLSNKTLNRHAGIIAGVFEWAIREGKLEGANPAKGHHRSQAEGEDGHPDARRSFTAEELKKLFSGELFSVPRKARIQPKRHSVETALAWLIPIALFSGMRLDEICGLRTDDVMDEGGILYFDLRSHEGRRLKTAAARRRVPVHSELVRIGFVSYLAHVKVQGHEYLFPALKPGGPDGKRSWYVSKRFTTYRRAVGVTEAGTVFHCFRKNAATALERARVPENEAVQIHGHKKLTMTYGLYSGGLELAGLKRVVEAITYPGLNLSRLHNATRQQMHRKPLASAKCNGRKRKSPAVEDVGRIDG